jgi:hypothetical protein
LDESQDKLEELLLDQKRLSGQAAREHRDAKAAARRDKKQGDEDDDEPSDDEDMSERSSWAYTPKDLQNPALIIKLIISRIDPSKSERATIFVLGAEGLLEEFGTPIPPGSSRVGGAPPPTSQGGGVSTSSSARRGKDKEGGRTSEGEKTTGSRRRSRSRGQEDKDKGDSDEFAQ